MFPPEHRVNGAALPGFCGIILDYYLMLYQDVPESRYRRKRKSTTLSSKKVLLGDQDVGVDSNTARKCSWD